MEKNRERGHSSSDLGLQPPPGLLGRGALNSLGLGVLCLQARVGACNQRSHPVKKCSCLHDNVLVLNVL